MFGKKLKNSLEVPFQSQNDEAVPEQWHSKACAIACVSMMIKYISGIEVPMENLINEALAMNSYTDHGWSHGGIVRVLRNHGVQAYSQEFRSDDVEYGKELFDQGIVKIIESINSGMPVMCSVKKDFNENKTSHIILITGFDIGSDSNVLIYHDPDSRNGDKKENKIIDISRFMEYWKGLTIFSD